MFFLISWKICISDLYKAQWKALVFSLGLAKGRKNCEGRWERHAVVQMLDPITHYTARTTQTLSDSVRTRNIFQNLDWYNLDCWRDDYLKNNCYLQAIQAFSQNHPRHSIYFTKLNETFLSSKIPCKEPYIVYFTSKMSRTKTLAQ